MHFSTWQTRKSILGKAGIHFSAKRLPHAQTNVHHLTKLAWWKSAEKCANCTGAFVHRSSRETSISIRNSRSKNLENDQFIVLVAIVWHISVLCGTQYCRFLSLSLCVSLWGTFHWWWWSSSHPCTCLGECVFSQAKSICTSHQTQTFSAYFCWSWNCFLLVISPAAGGIPYSKHWRSDLLCKATFVCTS